ncbi:MAG TPA: hypothetical protein VLW54_13175 [Candidatus Acidoferrales bacterium]|nr:hypothetical protein [Candidatus Acidoferrales bacterium]
MQKQVLKVTVVLALMLALASPSWASTVNVILDDPTTGGGSLAYFLPYGSTGPYDVSWQACTGSSSPVPGDELASGYQKCLAIVNNLGYSVTHLVLNIPDPSNDAFNCSVSDPSLGFTCTSSYSDGIETLIFDGIPGFAKNTEIYIGVGLPGDDVRDLGNPNLDVPTHDPNTLVLLLAGITLLAMAGVRRYAY